MSSVRTGMPPAREQRVVERPHRADAGHQGEQALEEPEAPLVEREGVHQVVHDLHDGQRQKGDHCEVIHRNLLVPLCCFRLDPLDPGQTREVTEKEMAVGLSSGYEMLATSFSLSSHRRRAASSFRAAFDGWPRLVWAKYCPETPATSGDDASHV